MGTNSKRNYNLYSLLGAVHRRSMDSFGLDETTNQIAEGKYEKILKVCLPEDLNSYYACINDTYPIHELIADLIYLCWNNPTTVNQEDLRDAVSNRLQELGYKPLTRTHGSGT